MSSHPQLRKLIWSKPTLKSLGSVTELTQMPSNGNGNGNGNGNSGGNGNGNGGVGNGNGRGNKS